MDQYGTLVIVRQIFPLTQVAQTVVWNEDGTQWAFGEQSVVSLLACNSAHSAAWISSMTNRQIHALIHEIGQRLVEGSQRYECWKAESARSAVQSHYRFFGLTHHAADKELDDAYRRLARAMHPDKNGGTDEAKRQFQSMKERYETLKAHRGTQGRAPACPDDADDPAAADLGREGQPHSRADADAARVVYDPSSRESLLRAAQEILRRLQVLHQVLASSTRQAGMGGG